MRCQSCDYELWHCTGRTCPECGEGFSLRDYFFDKDSVLFHCPHCDHGYKGGIPPSCLPADSMQCNECGGLVEMETYIVRPIDGHSGISYGTLLPNRLTHGNSFTRYVQTVWLVMTKPQMAIARVPVQEPLIYAWKFFLTTIILTLIVGVMPALLFYVFLRFASPGSPMGAPVMLTVFVINMGIVFIFMVLAAVFWSIVTHLLLNTIGKSAFTLRRTMQSILYGGGATIVSIVPCFGGITGSVWWIVSTTNMIVRGQQVSGGKASFACLTGPVLMTLFFCGGYTLLIASILSPALTNARVAAQQARQQRTVIITTQDDSSNSSEELSSDQQLPE